MIETAAQRAARRALTKLRAHIYCPLVDRGVPEQEAWAQAVAAHPRPDGSNPQWDDLDAMLNALAVDEMFEELIRDGRNDTQATGNME